MPLDEAQRRITAIDAEIARLRLKMAASREEIATAMGRLEKVMREQGARPSWSAWGDCRTEALEELVAYLEATA